MEGKTYGVTGGASGIGLALAKLLATRGAQISMCDISMTALEKARDALVESSPNTKPEDILLATCDVREPSQIQSWLKQTVQKFGRLDGAANVAGVVSKYHGMQEGYLMNQDQKEWDFVLGVNLTVGYSATKDVYEFQN